MSTYRHLFVMDPLEKLNIKLDSSLRMAFALTKRQDRCFFANPKSLAWYHKGSAKAQGTRVELQELRFNGNVASLSPGPTEDWDLGEMSSIHMRQDPPFDLDYLAATWLLDSIGSKSLVYNSPEALRRWNEKLIITRFPEATAPALVSAKPAQIVRFIQEIAEGDAILKPLDLFGGRGVLRLNSKTMSSDELLLKVREATADGKHFRLIQAFDKAIFDGEVRVFCAGPKALAWCLKKPADGQFLANTRAGAKLLPYEPSSSERKMVEDISAELMEEGIFFTGFDLIGGKVSEINITSPRLLSEGQDEEAIYDELAQLLCQDIERRTTAG